MMDFRYRALQEYYAKQGRTVPTAAETLERVMALLENNYCLWAPGNGATSPRPAPPADGVADTVTNISADVADEIRQ